MVINKKGWFLTITFMCLVLGFAVVFTACDNGGGDDNQTPIASDFDIGNLNRQPEMLLL